MGTSATTNCNCPAKTLGNGLALEAPCPRFTAKSSSNAQHADACGVSFRLAFVGLCKGAPTIEHGYNKRCRIQHMYKHDTTRQLRLAGSALRG